MDDRKNAEPAEDSRTEDLPRSIRASVHPDALDKVTRFFDATTRQVVDELFQNARRAGATRITVLSDDERTTVTDNGCGIADPRVLLAFGSSGWEGRAAAEDPAGMGLYSLARRGCRIATRTADGIAWAAALDEGHFIGKKAAKVSLSTRNTADGPEPHGTSVTFPGTADWVDVERAATYLPVDVDSAGRRLTRRDFLGGGSIDRTEWQGLKLAVVRCIADGRHGLTGNVNFHGLRIGDPQMPIVTTRETSWSVMVDVDACPRLELLLPTRREIVQNEFLEQLHARAERFIYQALASRIEAREVTRRTHQRAAALGIEWPEPPPLLTAWRAEHHDDTEAGSEAQPLVEAAGGVLINARLPREASWVLERARRIEAAGLPKLLRVEPAYVGFGWYDALPMVVGITATTIHDGEQRVLANDGTEPAQRQVDAIELVLTIRHPDGNTEVVRVATDTAFAVTSGISVETHLSDDVVRHHVSTATTRQTPVNRQVLRELLEGAYWCGWDEQGDGDWDRQHDEFTDAVWDVATRLLVSDERAIEQLVRNLGWGEIRSRLRNGQTVSIEVSKAGPDVRISTAA